jgi:hypothetical protein
MAVDQRTTPVGPFYQRRLIEDWYERHSNGYSPSGTGRSPKPISTDRGIADRPQSTLNSEIRALSLGAAKSMKARSLCGRSRRPPLYTRLIGQGAGSKNWSTTVSAPARIALIRYGSGRIRPRCKRQPSGGNATPLTTPRPIQKPSQPELFSV